jgi:hypothetical protein
LTRSTWLLRVAGFSWCALASCGARTPPGHQTESGAGPSDAAPDGHEAGAPTALDAAPPRDDAILPRSNDELVVRARHLMEAIAQDDVTLASDIIFPRDAWLATRDAADPGKDWDVHVATPFRKAVHVLSRRERHLNQFQVVSIELGGAMEQVEPRRHGWKKPLWLLSGSRLTFVVDGHTRTLPIREMVAWRGDWYVTRLR